MNKTIHSTTSRTISHELSTSLLDVRAGIILDMETATREGFSSVAERAKGRLAWIDEITSLPNTVICDFKLVITTKEA